MVFEVFENLKMIKMLELLDLLALLSFLNILNCNHHDDLLILRLRRSATQELKEAHTKKQQKKLEKRRAKGLPDPVYYRTATFQSQSF